MRVTIRFFAAFRDAAGTAEECIETGAATARELYDEVVREFPGFPREPNALVAINDAMCGWGTPLSDGDVVLLFPPVAGG